MKEVFTEICELCQAWGFTLDEAIQWIQQHRYEYDSVFLCDLQRVLNGSTEGVNYETN